VAGARWAALAAVAVIGMGAAGCGGEEKDEGTKIALVTAGTRDDPGWATQTSAAAVKVARRLRLGSEVVDAESDAAAGRALRRLTQDALVLIAPTPLDRAAARRVAAAEDVPTLLFGEPDALKDGLIGDVEVSWQEGAYVAGWLASRASSERAVGIVICDDGGVPVADRFELAAAYVAGARAHDPRTKATYSIAGADAEGAGLATREVLDKAGRPNGEIVFALCGTGKSGIVSMVERLVKDAATGETQIVGIVGEETELNRENIFLTSVMVDPTPAFEQAARDVRTDRFGRRPYTLSFANGGIDLLQTGRSPADAYEAAIRLAERLEDEPVDFPTASNEEELDAVIEETARS